MKNRLTTLIVGVAASAFSAVSLGAGPTATQILDHDTLGNLTMGERTLLQDFPLADAGVVTLDVERFTVLAPGARIVEQDGDQVRDLPDTNLVLLKGTIVGEDNDSTVFISVGQWGVNGVITRGDEYFSISSGPYTPEPGDEVLVTSSLDLDYINGNFCQVDANDPKYSPNTGINSIEAQPQFNTQRGTGCNLAPIAIDSDYEFTNNRFGGNTSAAADYAQTLMGASSTIYERDVNVTLSVAFLRTWATNTDPYSGDLGQFLDQVRAEWRTNMSGVSRVIVHGMSGRNLGGGVAYLDALCSNFWGYGVSALNGFFPNPPQDHSNQNWDIIVVPHEMGHNFGSPHTHDFNPVIDGCGNGDCTNAWGGTIMSYCHLCSGGLRNIVLNFHPRVIDVINIRVNNASCITSTGDAFVAVDDTATTITGLPINIDALANDASQSCGTPVILSYDTSTANGGSVSQVTGSPYDSFNYTPPVSFSGSDTFNYTLVGGSSATVTVNVQGLRPADNPGNPQPGAKVDYYLIPSPVALPDFSTLTPIASDVVPNIDYPATNGLFATSPLGNNVGAVFTGYVSVQFPGLYNFETESDDGSRLWIGNTLIVDNDGVHTMETQSGTIGLMGGMHEIRVEFFENTGSAGLIVRNGLSTQAASVIPPSNWFHSDQVACVPDWNNDGTLDFFDVSAYLAAFSAGDLAADLNSDGTLDFFDVSTFLSAFSAGCP